jgi:tetratricopeptide (TPR) repeat protein
MMNQAPPHPMLLQLFREALQCQLHGDKGLALVAYKRIQSRFPEFIDAWTNGSTILWEMGCYTEAHEMALRAVEINPENPAALCALANAEQFLGNIGGAIKNFQKAIQGDPAHVPALTNLAGIYNRNGEFEAALSLDDRAILSQPLRSELWGNRGHTKMRALDLAGAEADLRRALELDEKNALARWNLAYIQLLQNRYREAWPNFGARVELGEWSGNKKDFGQPHWGGEPLDGRTLLVYSEQGFGDTIQFVRFVPKIKDLGGRAILTAPRPLLRLLAYCPGIECLLDESAPLPEFDIVAPLMELPSILNLDIDSLAPLPPPSLPLGPEIPELGGQGANKLKVGLAWAGSPIHSNDKLRSMDARLLDQLADIPNASQDIAWYGIQKPLGLLPPTLPGFIDLSPYMGDFLDTAQIVEKLDLVVAVDTSVAHLAGLLGRPGIVLLAYMPDWRWGLGLSTTRWYPSLALVRQPSHGDWEGAISLLKERIANMAASRVCRG